MPFKGQTVSILGCGWLGLPLAVSLRLKQAFVNVTHHSNDPDQFRRYGLYPYSLYIDGNPIPDRLASFFQCDSLIILLPFKRSLKDPRLYYRQIYSLFPLIASSDVKQIIFSSSTSIYPSKDAIFTEDELLLDLSERSRVLQAVEQSLLGIEGVSTTILRFGGLYGPGRPIHRLARGESTPRHSHSRINSIHLDDCISIIETLIQTPKSGEIYNAVSDEHPRRYELYQRQMPVFLNEQPKSDKIVSNEKLKRDLNYYFIHPTPLDGH